MTTIQRIQRLCEARDMSINALEKKLGFSHNSLYERDENTPVSIRSDRLLAIARFFNVSTDWLLTGEETTAQFILSTQEKNLIELFRNLDDTGKRLMLYQYNVLADAGFIKKAARNNKVVVND